MKQCFSEPDGIIPRELTRLHETLDDLADMETTITEKWMHHQRTYLASCIEPTVKSKICRIFVRHQFQPATSSDRAHFLVRFDGTVLDPKYQHLPATAFSNLVDRIRVQTDKRYFGNYGTMEWNSSASAATSAAAAMAISNNSGKSAQIGSKAGPGGTGKHSHPAHVGSAPEVIQFKIYGDKQSTAKVTIFQSHICCQRYEISHDLRYAPFLRHLFFKETGFPLAQYPPSVYIHEISFMIIY